MIKNQQYSIAQLREIYLIVFPVWENSPIPRPDRRILLEQIRVLLVEENLENQIIIATLIIDFLFERERLFSDESIAQELPNHVLNTLQCLVLPPILVKSKSFSEIIVKFFHLTNRILRRFIRRMNS